jgi:cytochrome d ubiquinol oxidase subunit I
MQHPVGYVYNPKTHQDELASFREVLFNPAQLAGFPHVIAGCFLTAGALVAGVALWQLMRPSVIEQHALAFRHALKAGAITAVAAAVVVTFTGDLQGKLFTQHYQPMKMAAAEALYHTAAPAPFSLLTIGSLNGSKPIFEITLPRLLSFLADGNWSGQVQGIDNLQQQYSAQYGPGSYVPVIPVTYWSFRIMIGAGLLAGAIVLPFLPLIGNTGGWIMTEMGRQPWIVYGQMKTAAGVSANSGGEVLASLVVFTLLYGVLAVIEVGLMLRAIKAGLGSEPEPGGGAADADAPLELVY